MRADKDQPSFCKAQLVTGRALYEDVSLPRELLSNLIQFFSFFFSVNEDCLYFPGDALQRNTRQPLVAEACVAVQFATLSMLSPRYLPRYVATAKVRAPLAPILSYSGYM